ncbi:hypothetical protein CYMTET_3143 [Cymbomonas tetramitiformis]|uniref:Phosphatidylinositol-3,4,5-trisphosphate 3-phosphatase n=1 Tax=Cymbomonas tetramitiformis TaxID=36881 RepID=A0AAE0H3R6_9CHLO|nr:hypothetical protein CYMTET_3143 [Cymbomonas tetramitiformis]
MCSHIGFINIVRGLVSKKKRRFQEDGFDLDLSYITERIVGMGWPSEGFEAFYRNPKTEVLKFLQERHPGHFKIFNLCSEREYDARSFENRVSRCPFADHQAPPVELMAQFCEDVDTWLSADPDNVVFAHCKAGKGRTGVMICCYLLHSKMFSDPGEAMKYYASKRTKDGKGVTIASQARYIHYYAHYLEEGLRPERLVELSQIHLKMAEELHLIVVLYQRDSETQELIPKLSTHPTEAGTEFQAPLKVAREHDKYIIKPSATTFISGDVKLQFFDGSISKKSSLFYLWLNSAYLPHSGEECFKRLNLDKVRKSLDKNVELTMLFTDAPTSIAMNWACDPSPVTSFRPSKIISLETEHGIDGVVSYPLKAIEVSDANRFALEVELS